MLPARFYCFGPDKSPMEMTPNEASEWHGTQTPVLFNHHIPLDVNASSIGHIDLNPIKSTRKAVQNGERVLILTPLRDGSPYISKYFELLSQLSYPHSLIDLAFLVGDSDDTTFRSAQIIQKDFGVTHGQDVEDRHSFAAQGPRRKAIGRARNYLLYTALRPDHSWVYWRDVDIWDSPKPILEDLIAHDQDIIVPSKFLVLSEQAPLT